MDVLFKNFAGRSRFITTSSPGFSLTRMDLLEPLENAVSHMLIPAITERQCNQLDRNIIYFSAASSLGWPGPRKPFD